MLAAAVLLRTPGLLFYHLLLSAVDRISRLPLGGHQPFHSTPGVVASLWG